MAKVNYTTLLPDDTYIDGPYSSDLFVTKTKKNGFEIHEPTGGGDDYVVVSGTDFKYKNGYLVQGTITDVEFKNGLDNDYLSIKHAHYEIEGKLDLSNFNLIYLIYGPLQGNDTIVGSKEGDVLFGAAGSDNMTGLNGDDTLIGGISSEVNGKVTMTGNLGSDTFVFEGGGKVVVTDFDAVGGGHNQDYFYYEMVQGQSEPRIYADHHNTVINFGHGHTMTLVDVDRGDISMDDFKQPPFLAAD